MLFRVKSRVIVGDATLAFPQQNYRDLFFKECAGRVALITELPRTTRSDPEPRAIIQWYRRRKTPELGPFRANVPLRALQLAPRTRVLGPTDYTAEVQEYIGPHIRIKYYDDTTDLVMPDKLRLNPYTGARK